SRHALRWAKALARRTKGRLTVVGAVDPLLADAARLRFGLDLVHAETDPVSLNDAMSGTLGPVLAATDFSDTSARAIRWAADLAHEIGGPLLLVHVVEPIAV